MKRTRTFPLFAITASAAFAIACSDSPTSAKAQRDYIAVTTGGDHTCALATDGSAFCWGSGAFGELGIGGSANEFTPAKVQTDLKFKDISAGDTHTCALTTDGQAYCWGNNNHYQRGNADDGRDVPVPAQTTERFSSISAGAHHTCAISSADGRVFCWGYNHYGQAGVGHTDDVIRPAPVKGDLHAVAVSAGGYHTCAITAAGAMYCWGRNEYSQLGIGSDALIATVPTAVQSNLQFSSVDAGSAHTCGLAQQDVYCWGSSNYGELGDGAPFKTGLPGRAAPTKALALPSMALVSAGDFDTCASSLNGEPYCWGSGAYGQTGLGEDTAVPQSLRVDGKLVKFSILAMGGQTHTCGLADGGVYCWGTGTHGQLGVGTRISSAQPLRVTQ